MPPKGYRKWGSLVCKAEGCTEPSRSVGLCKTHYTRYHRHGDPNIKLVLESGEKCLVSECNALSVYGGYCRPHYRTVKYHNRKNFLYARHGEGYIRSDGYKEIRVNGERILEHVYIAERALGKKLPPDAVVHHMNENRLDNYTPFNLVICPNRAYHMLIHQRMRALKSEPFYISLEDL